MNKEESLTKIIEMLIKDKGGFGMEHYNKREKQIDECLEYLKQPDEPKPQISEEDFDKLYQELITFMKGFAVFEDLRGILEKYLKPQPPQTQGDKIRAMGNEELVMQLSCKHCIYKGSCRFEIFKKSCDEGILEFLNSEIKE